MNIPTILPALLAVPLLAGCDRFAAAGDRPAKVDPITVLEDQVAAERQLREKAETRTEHEAGSRAAWQMAALGFAAVTVVAFVGGTAIGSRGKRHADDPS